ncbi:hypothetical protein XPA_005343 [Xanthoria parietina]
MTVNCLHSIPVKTAIHQIDGPFDSLNTACPLFAQYLPHYRKPLFPAPTEFEIPTCQYIDVSRSGSIINLRPGVVTDGLSAEFPPPTSVFCLVRLVRCPSSPQ